MSRTLLASTPSLRTLTATVLVLWLARSLVGVPAHGQGLNTAQIVTDTVSCTDCTDWRVSGVCYWLQCSLTGCKIKTSVKVSHNLPDAIISTHNG